MKYISFNINGLRARPHQLAALVEKHQPDVIGLQEIKVHNDQFPCRGCRGLRLQSVFPRPKRTLWCCDDV